MARMIIPFYLIWECDPIEARKTLKEMDRDFLVTLYNRYKETSHAALTLAIKEVLQSRFDELDLQNLFIFWDNRQYIEFSGAGIIRKMDFREAMDFYCSETDKNARKQILPALLKVAGRDADMIYEIYSYEHSRESFVRNGFPDLILPRWCEMAEIEKVVALWNDKRSDHLYMVGMFARSELAIERAMTLYHAEEEWIRKVIAEIIFNRQDVNINLAVDLIKKEDDRIGKIILPKIIGRVTDTRTLISLRKYVEIHWLFDGRDVFVKEIENQLLKKASFKKFVQQKSSYRIEELTR